jgi:hypothetical protein
MLNLVCDSQILRDARRTPDPPYFADSGNRSNLGPKVAGIG